MDPKFQTSFIPKKPVVSIPGADIPVTRRINIFSVAAGIIFVITLLVSSGLFVYKDILTKQITEIVNNINTTRATFQPEKIQELIDIHSRIVASKTLLDKHVVVSQLLLLLQTLTVKRMRFTDFTFSNKNDLCLLRPSFKCLNGYFRQSFNRISRYTLCR